MNRNIMLVLACAILSSCDAAGPLPAQAIVGEGDVRFSNGTVGTWQQPQREGDFGQDAFGWHDGAGRDNDDGGLEPSREA